MPSRFTYKTTPADANHISLMIHIVPLMIQNVPLRSLVTWSDRGTRTRAAEHHGARPASDVGPLLRMLRSDDCPAYAHVTLLSTGEGAAAADELAVEVRDHVEEVERRTLDVRDPSNYRELFSVLSPLTGQLGRRPNLDVVLSAGTPQMQTVWVLLVQAGLIPARMVQVIPSAFVPDVHPSPIHIVELDFAGFPEITALREEVSRLRTEVGLQGSGITGDSPPVRTLRRVVSRIARADVPTIIHGETGSGKELVARAIHANSARRHEPFVAENCGALSDDVLQSELFGHEPGAFTGATRRHRGLFEQAHGGTLFLDEVGEMSSRTQVSLLRSLQDGTVRRVGGEHATRVDVRVLTATHRDLRAEVAGGRFREDLYYRLSGATVTVPPLRERLDDLPKLVDEFLSELDDPPRPTLAAMRQLARYDWPGNVRQLRAEVLRWTVFCDTAVRTSDLSPEIRGATTERRRSPTHPPARLADIVIAAETAAIEEALEYASGNLSQTARRLGIDRNTLKRKMARAGLR